MAELSSNNDTDQLATIPYEVLRGANVATPDMTYKLIIIGDSAVGKSCLMSRVMDEEFKIEHQVTIGVEFGSFCIKLDEKVVKLQIWDTAGQESFRSVTRVFYKGSNVVFLCFDLTREDTFNNLGTWLGDIRTHAEADVLVYLIGSKADLEEQREVSKEQAKAFVDEHGIEKYFETSSVTGYNIEEVFTMGCKDMYVRECISNAPPTPQQ